MQWPDELKAVMIRQARKKLRMKQMEFAELLGSSTATVCQWEMGRRIPRGPSWRMFLILMEHKGITFGNDGVLVDTETVNDSLKLEKQKSKKRAA
jgi:DNA-binding XRE family transcriptional regulator